MSSVKRVTQAKSFVAERRQLLNTLTLYSVFRVTRVGFSRTAAFNDAHGRQCVPYYYGECVAHDGSSTELVYFDRNNVLRRGLGVLATVIPNKAQTTFAEPINDFVANIPCSGDLLVGMKAKNVAASDEKRVRVPYKLSQWTTYGEQFHLFLAMLKGGHKIKRHELKTQLRVPNAPGPDDLFAIIMFVVIGNVQLFQDEQALAPTSRTMKLSAEPMEFIINIARLMKSAAMKDRILEAAPDMASRWETDAPEPYEADSAFGTPPHLKATKTDTDAYKDYELLVVPYEEDEAVLHAGFRESYKKRRKDIGAAAAAAAVAVTPAPPMLKQLEALQAAFSGGFSAPPPKGYTLDEPPVPTSSRDEDNLPASPPYAPSSPCYEDNPPAETVDFDEL